MGSDSTFASINLELACNCNKVRYSDHKFQDTDVCEPQFCAGNVFIPLFSFPSYGMEFCWSALTEIKIRWKSGIQLSAQADIIDNFVQ